MSLPPHTDPIQDPLPTANEVGRALTEVFARPEFAPPSPSLLEMAFQAIGRSIRAIWNWIVGPLNLDPGAERLVGIAIVVVVAAVALVAGFRLGRGAWRRWRVRPKAPRAEPGETAAAPGETSAAEWEARSREAAAAGRWRDAAVALYHALVRRLDERGVVRYDRAKTPGDYRREASGRPAALRALETFLGIFEPVAYGRVAGGRDEYERLKAVAAKGGARAG